VFYDVMGFKLGDITLLL